MQIPFFDQQNHFKQNTKEHELKNDEAIGHLFYSWKRALLYRQKRQNLKAYISIFT